MKSLVMTVHLRFEDSVATGEIHKEIHRRVSNIPGLITADCTAQPPYMPLVGPGLPRNRPIAIRMTALSAEQARVNHNQDLMKLLERGGISPAEAAALVQCRPYRDIPSADALMLLYGAKEYLSRAQ